MASNSNSSLTRRTPPKLPPVSDANEKEDDMDATIVDPPEDLTPEDNSEATVTSQLLQQMSSMAALMATLKNQLTDNQQENQRNRQAIAALDKRVADMHQSEATHTSRQDRDIPDAPTNSAAVTVPDNVAVLHQVPNLSTLSQRPFELPEFSGQPEHWPIFLAAFKQSTEEFRYSPLQNIFRLQRCLKGAARSEVQYLLINPNNIDELISTLQFRFGRPEILLNSQRRKIKSLDDIPERRMDMLIPYSSQVQNMVAFLNTPENEHVLIESTLLAELVSKLPESKQLEWIQSSQQFKPRANVIQFSKWLREKAECVSLLYNQSVNIPPTSYSSSTSGSSSGRNKQMVLNVNSQPTSSQVCCLCSRPHKVAECNQFRSKNIATRWSVARSQRICFGCLKKGHMFEECRGKRKCPVDGCTYWHHELLHSNDSQQQARPSGVQQQQVAANVNSSTTARDNPFREAGNPPAPVLTCRDRPDELPLLFKIVPVTLHGPRSEVKTFALIDEGSSLTLMDVKVAQELDLSGPVSSLEVQWFSQQSSSEQSQRVSLQISGSSQTKYRLKNVRTVQNLHLPMQSVTISSGDSRHNHLRGIPLAEYRNAVPRILIGLDHSFLCAPIDVRNNHYDGPIAVKSLLGWSVYGRQSRSPLAARVMHCSENQTSDDQLENLVKDYFTTENFGVKMPERELESEDDIRAREILRKTTTQVGARFQTGLLWRADNIDLPDSYKMAYQRLQLVERKMNRDPEYRRLYEQQVEKFLARGFARKLSPSDAALRTGRTWYLPHFGVTSVHKPGRLRLVFDAAAAVQGISINSMLLKGPDLNKSLATILLQFRMRKVGVCADIADMFLQIEMRPEDRESQRFLWRTGQRDNLPEVYEMCVVTFGMTCSPTSAQYVKNFNASKYENEFPDATKIIRESHYVDDMVASFETEEDAIRVSRDVVNIHKHGGFELRGFLSNSKAVLQNLGASPDESAVDMQMDAQASEKILGMRWRPHDDAFYFAMRFEKVKPEILAGERRPTKRELLSIVMSVFDPFGFLADFMIDAKLMVQDAFKSGIGWDEQIPVPVCETWRAWWREMETVKLLRIPRCYSANLMVAKDVQLHVYADASEQAFAAVAYFRIDYGQTCEVVFISAKTKCAPPKLLSVPRLELQAAVLAVRLQTMIRAAHPIHISKLIMWTDSRTVLQWINSCERRFRPFVAHRVAEILEGSGAACWRWLPTKFNVADDATRRKNPPTFDLRSRWLRGPEFLAGPESSWPTTPAEDAAQSDVEIPEEIKSSFVCTVLTGKLVDFKRFSNFSKLCRAIGWNLRFVHNALAMKRGRARTSGELNAAEILGATNVLCKIAQREGYPAEYAALENKQKISRTSAILSLIPYLDGDGLMRLYGRTDAANVEHLSVEAMRPILLPRNHRFTELLVHHHHVQMAHQLEDSTICAVRRRYWVPHLRQLVRTMKNRCQDCRIRAAHPEPPIAGQLPLDRLTPNVHAFKFTGLDYFGPVNVTIGRRTEKRWIALFTCLTTRAIHMEVAPDLSTDSCLLVLRNFCNTRGVPTRIRSDCGRNFVGADNELRRLADFIDTNEIQREMSTRGIEWLFNCPANPEAGGAWERLVQSTKRVLKITLKEVAPRVETLRSLIIEAANMLNSRPLTHIPVCPNEFSPLTPNHFLLGRVNATTTASNDGPGELCSRKQWRIQQQLMRHFWARWVAEYLPDLTRRTKMYKDVGPIKIGDLVLVCDANQSRGEWIRGRIVRTYLGTDGCIRTAEVRTKTGTIRRPVSKLAVLSVEGDESPAENSWGPGCRRADTEQPE